MGNPSCPSALPSPKTTSEGGGAWPHGEDGWRGGEGWAGVLAPKGGRAGADIDPV